MGKPTIIAVKWQKMQQRGMPINVFDSIFGCPYYYNSLDSFIN
jgi:hypothetical protein